MYVLKHGTVVVNDPERKVIDDGAIVVNETGRIEQVDTYSKIRTRLSGHEQHIDLSDHLIFPGMVNGHLHAYQSIFRGVGGGLPIKEWLEQVKTPALLKADSDIIVQGITVSLIETMRSGVTSVVNCHDVFTDPSTVEKVIQLTGRLGLRSIVSLGLHENRENSDQWYATDPKLDKGTPNAQIENVEQLINKWGDNKDDMLRIWFGPQVVASLTQEDMQTVAERARKLNSGLHIHVAEQKIAQDFCLEHHGQRLVEYLDSSGAISPHLHSVHSVWLDDAERKLLSQAQATIVHNPACNSFIGSGVLDIPAALKSNIPITLGTDAPSVNNTNDLIESLKLAVFLQRAHNRNGNLLPPDQVVSFATHGGAHAMGLDDRLGVLEPGRYADIIALRLDRPQAIPKTEPYGMLVFALHASDVDFVMVNGKVRILGDRFVDFDEPAVLREAHDKIQNFVEQLTP